MNKIDTMYFWLTKLVSAVLMFSGSMFWLKGVDELIQYVFSFLLTAFILKITWK